MPYGSLLTDVVQSSTAGTPPRFNDGNGTQTGTLCRAWVNFNGVTTATIRASFNVSSVTRNATGDYTVNFTTAMTDANYSAAGLARRSNSTAFIAQIDIANGASTMTTSSIQLKVYDNQSSTQDADVVAIAIFR